MNAPLYTIEVLRLAGALPEPRRLERVDGTASKRSPTCGSTVSVEVQLSDDRIAALSQQVSACAFGQASAALVALGSVGRTAPDVRSALAQLTAWLAGRCGDPPDWPGLGALAPARSRKSRHGALLLPLQALAAALETKR